MKDKTRRSAIAWDLGIHHRMAEYHGMATDSRKFHLFHDITYISSIVHGSAQKSPPIHIYDIISLECNAACHFDKHNGEAEIGMFAGLRDVIYTFSKFSAKEPRLFTDIGDFNSELELDYKIFKEPIGFQNVSIIKGGNLEFYPNDAYMNFFKDFQPRDKTRLACSEVIRISSELFVWFHELYHLWRQHIQLLNKFGFSSLTITETNTSTISDENKVIQRYCEHDADLMALHTLIENLKQGSGPYYDLISIVGKDHGYRLLFYGVFCTMTTLMIAGIISRSLESNTHPNVFDRISFLVESVIRGYNENDEIRSGLDKAFEDWKLASTIFEWKAFIGNHVTIAPYAKGDFQLYYEQVGEFIGHLQGAINKN